jgi:hypothetical protein
MIIYLTYKNCFLLDLHVNATLKQFMIKYSVQQKSRDVQLDTLVWADV